MASHLDRAVFDVLAVLADDPSSRDIPSVLEVRVLPGPTEAEREEQLVALLRKERPDIAIAHLTESNVRVLRARERLDWHLPVIAVEHSMPFRLAREYIWEDDKTPEECGALFAQARKWYPRADALVAMCRTVAADVAGLVGVPVDRVRVIPNPVIPEDVADRLAGPVDHPWFQEHEVVLGLGRFHWVKNFGLLLSALPRVLEVRPGVRLALVGRGELYEALRELARTLDVSEHVWFPGWIADPFPYLAAAKVVAVPSFLEGLPNVLLEALACHTPVVATSSAGGSWEMLAPTGLGRVVAGVDVDAFADALVAVLENPPPEDAYDAVVRPHTIPESLARYRDLVEELVAR
jgi:glycosyltransferase involved in cell wall biosynthesis